MLKYKRYFISHKEIISRVLIILNKHCLLVLFVTTFLKSKLYTVYQNTSKQDLNMNYCEPLWLKDLVKSVLLWVECPLILLGFETSILLYFIMSTFKISFCITN